MPRVALLFAAGALVLSGCEPDSVTAARDQLGRGPARTVQLTLPLAVDTLTIGEFLAGDSTSSTDTATTPSGIRAVLFDPESLQVNVGDLLRFDGLTFDPFAFSYDQMLVTDEVTTGITLPAPPIGAPRPSAPFAVAMATPDTVTFGTAQGSVVTGATVASGYVVRTLVNNTDCDATVGVNMTDAGGGAVVAFPNVPVPLGTTFTDSVSAAGAAVDQFISVDPNVSFGVCIPTGGSVAADFTFRPMTLSSVSLTGLNETFTDNYAALAGETRIQAVDTVIAASGTLALTVQNRLPVALDLALTVQGITQGGVTLQRNLTVPAAPGDGSTVSAALNVDLTGAVIVPGAVLALVQGTAAAPSATITPAVTSDAVVVDGGANVVVDYLAGTLDPAQTPELTVSVESVEPVESGSVDFGDFEDAVRGATINEATFRFTIANGLQTPITLDNYTVGLARTDAGGNPLRDLGGNILYETDTGGAPLQLVIASPGTTTLALPPGGTADVQITSAAPLLDRLVHLVLDNTSVALVGAGSAVVGDGTTVSRIDAADAVVINLALLVGLDLTLPDTGVVFTTTEVVDGAGLDSADADDLAARLVDARATSDVSNGIPFGVEVEIALIAGDRGTTVDVFTLPGHVTLSTVVLGAATVDPANGRTTAPTLGSVEGILSAADSRVLFGDRMTATVRIRIRPPAGSGGRGAIVSGDPVIIDARAAVAFTTGGAQ